MRRVEPAYPDLFPVTHIVRPGYLPGPAVSLDPVRMGVVWADDPRRTLPREDSVPREPVRAIVFSRVAHDRREVISRLLERGSSVLLVLDDVNLAPADLGLASPDDAAGVVALLPILPAPLADGVVLPEAWRGWRWGAVLGLFPFPGAGREVEDNIERLKGADAAFVVAAPLLLTPKDRHRILDACEGINAEERLENCLFHADPSRRLQALERRAGVAAHAAGMDPVVSCLTPRGFHPSAVRTAAMLRLWARRLDQSHEESSWGWRLRRAASALDRLPRDPHQLAAEDNLRVIPGFDPWVEGFTRALWHGGDPVDSAWRLWAGVELDER
jgi:hypothetical protein